MSPKKRLKVNKPHPENWRWKNGAWRYRVPEGTEHLWDGKGEFTLGKTTEEAYKTWSERLNFHANITLYNDAFDKYLIEVVPEKASSTHKYRRTAIEHLRPVFGAMPIGTAKPKHVHIYREEANKRYGWATVNHDIEVFLSIHTHLVQWGLLDDNPLAGKNQKYKNPKKSDLRYVEDWEIIEVLKVAVPWMRAFIRLKLITGMRQTDLLLLQASDLTDRGIKKRHEKTKKSSGRINIIKWTDELREAVDQTVKARPVLSPYLFCNRRGECYVKDDGSAEAFSSAWDRLMKKAIKETKLEKRFKEKNLRKKTASDMPLELASALLGHTSQEITDQVYRIKGREVEPHSLKGKI